MAVVKEGGTGSLTGVERAVGVNPKNVGDLPALIKPQLRDGREVVARKLLVKARGYLNALVGRNDRLKRSPGVYASKIPDCGGEYVQGSKDVGLDQWGVNPRTASHELWHFQQNRCGFAGWVEERFPIDNVKITAKMWKDGRVRYQYTWHMALLEAGAYFFGYAFALSEAVDLPKNGRLPTDYILDLLYSLETRERYSSFFDPEHYPPDLTVRSLGPIYKCVKENDLQRVFDGIDRLVKWWVNFAIPEPRKPGILLAKDIAILVFAANDFDIQKTVRTLNSPVDAILQSIGSLSVERLDWVVGILDTTGIRYDDHLVRHALTAPP